MTDNAFSELLLSLPKLLKIKLISENMFKKCREKRIISRLNGSEFVNKPKKGAQKKVIS